VTCVRAHHGGRRCAPLGRPRLARWRGARFWAHRSGPVAPRRAPARVRGDRRGRLAGGTTGWSLTDRGRSEDEQHLAAELEATGARPTVVRAHTRFLPANARFQDAVTRRQVPTGSRRAAGGERPHRPPLGRSGPGGSRLARSHPWLADRRAGRLAATLQRLRPAVRRRPVARGRRSRPVGRRRGDRLLPPRVDADARGSPGDPWARPSRRGLTAPTRAGAARPRSGPARAATARRRSPAQPRSASPGTGRARRTASRAPCSTFAAAGAC